MSTESLINCEHVSCTYGNAAVLDDVYMQVNRGEFVGVVGPSGSGKTTLLRALIAEIDPGDVLVTDPARPFARRDGWLTWALLTAVASPFAIAGAGALAAAVSGSEPVGRGTADAVAGVLGADASTVAALFVVTAILAPILEETVFRGFLLPSLTKWMPVPAAVCVSALAFAGAHLSARDFPQLAAFGVLLGFSYARSRNLLTTMAVHGAWNGSVLLVLAVGVTVTAVDAVPDTPALLVALTVQL
jgi:membrane protease YdiL (CAAX protease family)